MLVMVVKLRQLFLNIYAVLRSYYILLENGYMSGETQLLPESLFIFRKVKKYQSL